MRSRQLPIQATARSANTVKAVAKRFIDQDAKPNIESWNKIERALELHVYPEWGERNIGDIRRRDVHELLDGLIAKGKTGIGAGQVDGAAYRKLMELPLRELFNNVDGLVKHEKSNDWQLVLARLGPVQRLIGAELAGSPRT